MDAAHPIIKPIETSYNGYRFRSRLEARWAVFFDALKLPYQYEKEGYDLGDGIFYLPDFWLPEQDCWIEVKARAQWKSDDMEKAVRLTKATEKFLFFLFDHIGPIETIRTYTPNGEHCKFTGSNVYVSPRGEQDGMMSFGECYQCGRICIGHLGSHSVTYNDEDNDRGCLKDGTLALGNICHTTHSDRSPRLLSAYSAARSARFEYGEKPKL